MNLPRFSQSLPLVATAAVAQVAFVAAAHAQEFTHQNLTAGGKLRPGVYGRIDVRGPVPPEVIYSHAVVVRRHMTAANATPSYLYVPPGQVRKWAEHCHKWRACEEPVLFVRVDESPSRWGRWKTLRGEQVVYSRSIS